MKRLFIILLAFIFLLSNLTIADAAAKKVTPTPKKTVTSQKKAAKSPKKSTKSKKQMQKKTTKKSKPVGKISGGGKIKGTDVAVSYKLQGSSLVVTFNNLKNVTSLSYTLTYFTDDQQEAAVGTVTPKGKTAETRSILLGTCSGNVCRLHPNLSDGRLEVKAKLKSKKTFSASYNIVF